VLLIFASAWWKQQVVDAVYFRAGEPLQKIGWSWHESLGKRNLHILKYQLVFWMMIKLGWQGNTSYRILLIVSRDLHTLLFHHFMRFTIKSRFCFFKFYTTLSLRFVYPGVSKLRPSGQIRPAKPFHPTRKVILLIMKK